VNAEAAAAAVGVSFRRDNFQRVDMAVGAAGKGLYMGERLLVCWIALGAVRHVVASS